MKALTLAVVVAGMVFHARLVEAQTMQDSSSVVLAALDSILGAPPWDHPGGKAGAICLGASSERGGYLDLVARALQSRGAHVGEGCRSERAATFGGWVVTAAGSPAIRVSIQQLNFVSELEATARIQETRGGRWGRGEECRTTRASYAEPWVVDSCTLLWIS